MFRRLSLFLCLLPVFATSQSFKIEKFKLPNGLTVILSEDHSLPIVSTNIWYRVGSKDEPDRRSGFAHLFEHLMFMGTKRVPNGVFDTLMEEYGGANNASTWEDKTNYYDWGPSSLLPVLLWEEADRLESLADDMTLEKLNLQREVVKNERRENTENTPYGKAYEAINGLMFPPGHPYHTSVIGSMEDLNAASLQDVQDFFRTFYVPNNASLVVVGDFEPKATKALISKLFGTLKRGNDVVRKSVPSIGSYGNRRLTMVDDVSSAKTIMVWHSAKAYDLADFASQLGAGILGDGAGSRLYQALVVKKGLASDIAVYQESRLLGSLFYVDATAREGISLSKLESAIDEEIAKFLKNGPTQLELDRQVATRRFRQTNSLQQFSSRADFLNEYNFYFGDPNSFGKEQAMIRSITPQSVKGMFKFMDLRHRLVLRVIPQIEQPETNPRETKPDMAPGKIFPFPAPTVFSLPNGNTVNYWQKQQLPITTVTLRLEIGAAADPAEKSGLASLMADMLQEGAGGKSSEQFANALDALGASFGTSADQRGITITLTAPTEKLAKAIPLMADAVLRPNLKAIDWERVKAVHLQGLEEADDDPGSVASKVASREFFGENHPYGRPTSGKKETVSKLTLADVKAEYNFRVTSGLATWYASGSIAPAEIKKLLSTSFGNWLLRGPKMKRKAVDMPLAGASRLLIVDRPNAVQTAITILFPSVPFSSADRPALQELGIVLGGTFTSRLNRNLREEKGYTYGIGFGFRFSREVSYSSLRTSVRTDVTGKSLAEIIREIESIRSGNVNEAEAGKARSQFQYDAVTNAETIQGLVGAGIGYAESGISLNNVQQELSRFANLTAGDLNRVAQYGIPWGNAIIVLVGDQKEILKQIEGLVLPKPEFVKP